MEAGKALQLAPSPLSHGFGQLALEIDKEEERLAGAMLLTHEQHGNPGREEQDRHHRSQRFGVAQLYQPIAEAAIADLVVVLQEVDEGRGREMSARLPTGAAPIGGELTLIDK